MRKLVSIFIALILVVSVFAEKISIGNGEHGYKVIGNTDYNLKMEYDVDWIDYQKMATEKGDFAVLSFDYAHKTMVEGQPALPTFNTLIEMPYGADAKVRVQSFDVKEYKLSDLGITVPVMPAQPSFAKSINPADIYFAYDNAAYQKDSFGSEEIAFVQKNGTMRGIGVGTLVVSPIKYNPATGIIKVYTNLVVEVDFVNAKADAYTIKRESYSPYFEDSFAKLVNYKPISGKEDLTVYPVTYLIVANDQLEGNADLERFIDWKTEKGFKVVEHYVTSSTSYTEIDTWIEDQYANLDPKPSFILIVGDADGSYAVQPRSSGLSSGVSVSDLDFGVIGATSLSNHVKSMYTGRFSVRAPGDLTAQVDKTIWYEKEIFTQGGDTSYLENCMVVAGADGSHQATYGNPHVLYAMEYYFNDTYQNPVTGQAVNINGIPYLDGASGQSGNIIQHVSDGVAYYNYTAHGSNTSFGDPSFTISDINGLSNDGKYGLIIGNCCLTGSFGTDECFGEAWLNAADKGSIGFIGASASTYWDEDLAMGVGEPAVGNSTPAYSPDSPGMVDGAMHLNYPTQAAIMHVGLLAVDAMSSSRIMYYWEAYHLFGDPSLMPFLGEPNEIEVTHAPTVIPGASSYTVNAIANSYVALSDEDGVLHGAAMANESGVANVQLTEPFMSGDAKLVVTTQFQKPHFEDIPVVPLDGPYDIVNNYNVHDDIYGEESTIDLELKNIGTETSPNVTVAATTESEFATITNGNATFGTIASGDSVMVNSALAVDIANNVPNGEEIRLDLVITDTATKNTYEGRVKIFAKAPVIAMDSFSVSGQGTIQPGTTRDVTFTIANQGEAAATGITAALTELNGVNLNINNANQTIGAIAAGASIDITYTIDFNEAITVGTVADLKLNLDGDKDVTAEFNQIVTIGMTEDFESGDFTGLDWNLAGDADWTVVDDVVFDGTYSAKTGAIGHDGATSIAVTFNFTQEDGTVSFFRKASSESGYDFLKFYIDETEMGEWSGDVDWSEVTFDVPGSGSHELKWEYSKDGSVSNGDDCAWVDNILVTGVAPDELPPVVNNIEGLVNYVNNDLNIQLTVEDQSSVASVVGKAFGGTVTIPMEPVENKKGLFIYTGTVAAQSSATTSDIYFEMEDSHGNAGTSSNYTIEWTNDVDPPEFVSLAGTITMVNNPMELVLTVSDGSGIASIMGKYSINGGAVTDLPMTAVKDYKNLYVFSGELPAQSSAVTGTIYFEMEDTQGYTSTSDTQDLSWVEDLTLFEDDFEGDLSKWTQEHMVGSQEWEIMTGGHNGNPAAAHGGLTNATLLHSTTGTTTKLVSEEFDASGVSGLILTFSHAQVVWAGDQDELKVYCKSSASSNWQELAHYNEDIAEWEERTIEITDGLASGFQIAFEGIDGYGYGVCIDDVKVESAVGIGDDEIVPAHTTLHQNYPNPFNPETTIRFFNKVDGKVKLHVYNAKGELVQKVINNQDMKTGYHTINFTGHMLNSGVYFYMLETPDAKITKKMLMVK